MNKFSKGKKYTTNAVIYFKKIKNYVQTQNGRRMLSPGEFFIPLTDYTEFKWFGTMPLEVYEITD